MRSRFDSSIQAKKTNTQLIQLDTDFLKLAKLITPLLQFVNKHDKIRVLLWIKKLDGKAADNLVWKDNRNFYIRVLYQMVKQNMILDPFNKAPPQGPLKKLTRYDIPYPFTSRFSLANDSLSKRDHSNDSFVRDKQNYFIAVNKKEKVNSPARLQKHKKTLTTEMQTTNRRRVMFNQNMNEFSATIDLNRKNNNNSANGNIAEHHEDIKATMKALKLCYSFLTKNQNSLCRQPQYFQIKEEIQKLVEEPKLVTTNFKNFSERIKEKLQQTGQQSRQFLHYLHILKNK